MAPTGDFVATKIFAAVGSDRAYVFCESGEYHCTPPAPLSRASYEELAEEAHGSGA
jgi:hypothetical protein